jgi:uncharacterized membrane protein YbhN (UPF0104 family)
MKLGLKNRFIRQIVAVTVIIVTITVFVDYFRAHPAVGRQLHHTSPELLASLIALYLLSIVALAGVTYATLRLCKITLGKSESFLLTAYTAVINFFGPLQSGPAFRAVYLKTKYDLKLKNYAAATLVYYFFWGVYSLLMLFSGKLGWWLTAIALVALLAGYRLRQNRRLQGIDLHGWYLLALATLAQIAVVSLIYFLELRSVAPGTAFSQAIIYTGAANLALFVSLTPAAIGFRESFLLLSQRLHDVSNSAIVAANILDRAVYVIVLLGLALYIFGTHAGRRLKV